jgi:hypothetical protein
MLTFPPVPSARNPGHSSNANHFGRAELHPGACRINPYSERARLSRSRGKPGQPAPGASRPLLREQGQPLAGQAEPTTLARAGPTTRGQAELGWLVAASARADSHACRYRRTDDPASHGYHAPARRPQSRRPLFPGCALFSRITHQLTSTNQTKSGPNPGKDVLTREKRYPIREKSASARKPPTTRTAESMPSALQPGE